MTSRELKIKIKKNKLTYFVLISIIFIYSLQRYKVSALDSTNIFSGGDVTAELFAIKVATKANLIGIVNTLGWPNGFALWSEPLLGLGPYFSAIILSKVFLFNDISVIYLLTTSIGITINAIAAWWMVNKEFENKKYTYFFSFIIGISPFALMRLGHIPVAWLFFPFIFLGVAFKLNRNQITRKKALIILFITGTFSPLWWTIVCLLIAFALTIVNLIGIRLLKKNLKDYFVILLGTGLSTLPTIFLNYLSRDYSGETSRFPWQSNIFGGKLSDLLLSSPFLNQVFDLKSKISEGVSPEATNSHVGILLGILTVYLILELLLNKKIRSDFLPDNFYSISLVFLLFFVTGGLGNLQAGLLVLLGEVSPARTWFRLIFFLGILGLYLLLKIIEHSKASNFIVNIFMGLAVLLTFFDNQYINFNEPVKKESLAEYAAVNFLDKNTTNCPVLQLPVDTYPLNQDFQFINGSKFAYNQMMPYLLSENNKWSLVGIPGNKFWNSYRSIPVDIDSSKLANFKNQGFCAILFDKDFSNWQIERKAGLDYTIGFWPGLTVNIDNPDFEDTRYKVYLLNQ